MNKTEFIARSQNGIDVYYDPVGSHAATHLEDTPQLKSLVKEVIGQMTLEDDAIMANVDMGRVVGTSDVVNIDESDDIVYAVRKNRDDDGHVPFTKSREGEPCPFVSVQLTKLIGDSYVLDSCWIGTFTKDDEPFPESPRATERSREFWSKRAFVWGSQEIRPDSVLDNCPW